MTVPLRRGARARRGATSRRRPVEQPRRPTYKPPPPAVKFVEVPDLPPAIDWKARLPGVAEDRRRGRRVDQGARRKDDHAEAGHRGRRQGGRADRHGRRAHFARDKPEIQGRLSAQSRIRKWMACPTCHTRALRDGEGQGEDDHGEDGRRRAVRRLPRQGRGARSHGVSRVPSGDGEVMSVLGDAADGRALVLRRRAGVSRVARRRVRRRGRSRAAPRPGHGRRSAGRVPALDPSHAVQVPGVPRRALQDEGGRQRDHDGRDPGRPVVRHLPQRQGRLSNPISIPASAAITNEQASVGGARRPCLSWPLAARGECGRGRRRPLRGTPAERRGPSLPGALRWRSRRAEPDSGRFRRRTARLLEPLRTSASSRGGTSSSSGRGAGLARLHLR